MTGRNGDVKWPCFIFYKLPDARQEIRYQGNGYKGEHKDPELEAAFLNTHGSSPEELAGRMRSFVSVMRRWYDCPPRGACEDVRWEKLSPDEERRFFEALGIDQSTREK